MKYTIAVASVLLGAAVAVPQGVTSAVSPAGAAPSGCAASHDGKFEISVGKVSEKRDLSTVERRGDCGKDGILVLSLSNGVLTDAQGRIGYIASNYQFQFDGPPQAGAIYTSGFSYCSDGLLAFGGNKTMYQCKSGTFYNLYDRSWAAQCEPVQILGLACGSGAAATQNPDGQVVGTTIITTTIVTALSDGQPQVVTKTSPLALCQIGDGQVQVKTTPCISITSKAAPTTTAVPVSQYSDGQIQVTPPGSAPPVSAPPATTPVQSSVATGTTVAPPPPPPASSAPVPTSVPAITSNATTSVSVSKPSPTPVSSTAASSPSPSTPPTSGAANVAGRSLGALMLGLLVAFAYL